MQRLCGRPGCSELATVAYGMRTQDLVFWLDVLPSDPAAAGGALCVRHADAMVVPRGWTLDDLRDPDLHLFRPPAAAASPARPASARATRPAPVGEQLRLGVSTDIADEPADVASPGSWTPQFDQSDDLDGLLSARSPLLSRAFRTAEPDDDR